MTDKEPSEPKSLVELTVKKPQTRAAPGGVDAPASGAQAQPQTPEQSSGGHADAAAVLTAVDEDEEGVEEAEMPEEFEYHSDGEGGGQDGDVE